MTCSECPHPCDGTYYIDKRWPLCRWCYEKLIARQWRGNQTPIDDQKLYQPVPGGYRKVKHEE